MIGYTQKHLKIMLMFIIAMLLFSTKICFNYFKTNDSRTPVTYLKHKNILIADLRRYLTPKKFSHYRYSL